MTKRAGDPKPGDAVVGVHGGLQANDGIHLQQRHWGGRTLEIDLLEGPGGKRIGVDFEPDLERSGRIDALLDNLVQAKRVGPELFVTERVEAKHALAFRDVAR